MIATSPQFEGFYNKHFATLTALATSHYKLSRDDADEIVHSILLASLQKVLPADPKAWLEAALRYAVERRPARA